MSGAPAGLEALTAVVRDVWSAYLSDLDVDPAPAEDPTPPGLTGTVTVAGAWEGRIELTCSPAAARAAAATMLLSDDGALTDRDVHDALGELTNIVGGNMKSLVPSPSRLSVPEVGTADLPRQAGRARLVAEAAFTWTGEPVAVRIWTTSTGA